MIETPATFAARTAGHPSDPGDDLTGFRFHTGADLRRLSPDEPCPVLFRDLGPEATARFLRGDLNRLAGPLSPITYLRTEAYLEPYEDFERIGRIIVLRPLELQIWHSGVASIYVAKASRRASADALGFVPGAISLTQASQLASDARDARELREALGGRLHDEAAAESLHQLGRLAVETEAAERLASPLRREFQAAEPSRRDRAIEAMSRVGLDEQDLCAAWHHISRDRRGAIVEALRRIEIGSCGERGARPAMLS